jgi:hypothetical protein
MLIGMLLCGIVLGSAWAGITLADRAAITQALLTTARCDPGGLVTLLFADGSQYTCIPAQQMPPASRDEARARRHAVMK